MKLKAKKKTIFEVDYKDLERLIKEEFGHDFSIPADEEVGNDTSISKNIQKEELAKYDKDRLTEFLHIGRYGPCLQVLMTDMANRDVIEEGDYVIRVSW